MLGNVIVGQSGGPTSVINSSLVGVYKTARDCGANKVYGMLNGIQGLMNGKYVDLSKHIKNDLDIELLKRTPSSYLGSCRYKLPKSSDEPEVYESIFAFLEKHDIKAFFYIGGNDSMDTILKLADYGESINSDIRFIGVPKTIDNDLAVTDHTPGFGSAAKFIASCTKDIIRDSLVYDQENVTILEIMGRNAGWLTGAAALSRGDDCKGPDMIFLPERPIDMEVFLKKLSTLQKIQKSVFVAISEGVKTTEGKYLCELENEDGNVDAFGHKMLSGAGRYMAQQIKGRIGCKTRYIELSTLQRCASHMVSRVDITEAFQVGGAAVKAAMAGDTGKMIILKRVSSEPYQCTTDVFDLHHIANVEKIVPQEWITKDGSYVTKEFINYVQPLIQAELSPVMVNGLPAHLYFDTGVGMGV